MSSNQSRVSITGMGLICAAGNHVDSVWQRAFEKQSAIENGLGRISETMVESLRRSNQEQKVFIQDPILDEKPFVLTLASLQQCLDNANWKDLRDDDGFIFATTTGLVSTWDTLLMQRGKGPETYARFQQALRNERLGSFLDKVCESQNFRGKRLLVSSACAASTHALSMARDWILSGRVKRCLVGATEVLSVLTIEGFKSFQLLSSEIAKPFDRSRSGINLSEGSAFVCLENNADHALAHVLGGGMTSDGFHMTAPHPEGRGSYRAMEQALANAHVSARDVSWVHAHGTGSTHNDLSEGTAIAALFPQVPVSSTKAVHGHALAAAGLIETVLCAKSLQEQTILPTTNFQVADPKISLNVAVEPKEVPLRYILKNTLGFGGSNGAVLLGAA